MFVRALIALSLFAAGCRSEKAAPAADPPTDEPVGIRQVLATARPLDLYRRAYAAFSIESTTQVTVDTGTEQRMFQGHSLLKMNESGDFLLIREPLYEGAPTEIRSIGGKAFLRSSARSGFVRTRHQDEFDRWANGAVREILALYEKNGFADGGDGVLRESAVCLDRKAGSLCSDPATGLPLSGGLTVPRTESPPVRVEFKVAVFGPGTLAIPSP